jgi:hypothetical protein
MAAAIGGRLMPWGRLDDSLYDHPKLDLLPADQRLAGVGLWAVAISWSNRYLTDGRVPSKQIGRLGGTTELADELVVAGLFDEADDGYVVHDFHDFNDAKVDVLERRSKDAARKSEWRKRQLSRRDTSPVTAGQDDQPSTMSQRDGEMSQRDMSQRDSRARDVARDVARIPTRPDPSRPIEKAPSPLSTRATNGAQPTLSKDELESWRSFGPEWDAFRLAWIHRGFRIAPSGSSTDDDSSQRGLLWQILDSRPSDLVRWVHEAPAKAKHPSDVLSYVLQRWHEVRAEAGLDDDVPGSEGGPTKAEAAKSLADILAGM